jgi:DNA-binding HxlR family transcriptional regulator
MRRYRQYCGVAKALDVIGERWTLLIIRELFALRRARYSDLRSGLPGIPTNLLADRLRDLEANGLITRHPPTPPVGTAYYDLTERGAALWPVLRELGTWAGPLLSSRNEDDEFRTHWLALPVHEHLTDNSPNSAPARLTIDAGGESMTITIAEGRIEHSFGEQSKVDATLVGEPAAIVRVLTGRAKPGPDGPQLLGDASVLERALKS